jgi:hypothetical protein
MIGLRLAKRLAQDALPGVPHAAVRQYETGHKVPGTQAAESIADALDSTLDYLFGRGDDYGGETSEAFRRAAAYMAFDVFSAKLATSADQRERCRRLRDHGHAPLTAESWKGLAEMIDLAVPCPPRFEVLNGGR